MYRHMYKYMYMYMYVYMYMYMCMYMYVHMAASTTSPRPSGAVSGSDFRPVPETTRVPSLLLASSFRKYLNYAVLKCVFPWRARHPLS